MWNELIQQGYIVMIAIAVVICLMFWWPLVLVSWHYWVG